MKLKIKINHDCGLVDMKEWGLGRVYMYICVDIQQ